MESSDGHALILINLRILASISGNAFCTHVHLPTTTHLLEQGWGRSLSQLIKILTSPLLTSYSMKSFGYSSNFYFK
jgi:hypothetical protein